MKIIKSLADVRPDLVSRWHPTKNGDLTPEKISYSSNKKVWWKCPVADDHEWQVKPSSYVRLKGSGCPCCDGKKTVGSNCLAATHPHLISQWHKKNELTPKDYVCGSHKKVWWICDRCHEWEAMIKHRTSRNSGCPYCANRLASKDNCLEALYPDIANEWHPIKNGKLTPSDVTYGCEKKVWWRCEKNHEWITSVNHRTGGRRCPFCKESRGESLIVKILTKNDVKFERQHKFPSCKNVRELPFDFVVYDNDKIYAIEYQGKQHYIPFCWGATDNNEFTRLKLTDQIKHAWCKENGIPQLVIPYWEFDNMENLISNFLQFISK